jgi:hypothetical protein
VGPRAGVDRCGKSTPTELPGPQAHKLTPPSVKFTENHEYDRKVNELLYGTTPTLVWSE